MNLEKEDLKREKKQLLQFNARFQDENIAELMMQRLPTPKKCRSAYNFFIKDAH